LYLQNICKMKYMYSMDIGLGTNFRLKWKQYLINFILLFFLCYAPVHANAIDSENQIVELSVPSIGLPITNFPVVIDKPGVYSLNASPIINETAIQITSSDVLLDGLGQNICGDFVPGSVGIYVFSPDVDLFNITIKNITLQQYDAGLKIGNSSEIFLDSVTLNSNNRGGLIVSSSTDILVTNSEIKNNRNEISGGYGIEVSDAKQITLKNSFITGNGKTGKTNSGGMILTGSPNAFISGCQIAANPGFGIKGEYESDFITITDSDITGNSGDGITISNCMNPTIRDCDINKNKNTGISLHSIYHPSLIGNTISSAIMGLCISETTDMVLSGNKISNNRIGLDISASDITFLNHQISPTNTIDSRALIYLNGVNNRSIGLKENPATVIAVNCSDISIADLVLSKNGAGVYLAGCKNIDLSDISFLENGIGLKADFNTSNIMCSRLHAERNLVSGYYLSHTHNFTLNSLYGQDSPSGIYLLNATNGQANRLSITSITGPKSRMPSGMTLSGCKNLSITGSEFSKCSYAGLVSDSEELNLSHNSFTKNTFAGTVILSGLVDLNNNTFNKNDGTGLILRTNDSKVIDNTFSFNQARGLLLVQGNQNSITGNIFKNGKNCEISGESKQNMWSSTLMPDFNSSVTGGNYWGDEENQGYSDQCTSDPEGYCSDPYIVNSENIDYRPLSSSASWYSLTAATDVNQNGRADLQDVVTYMNKVRSGDTHSLYDFSGDGRINLNDVVALFQKIIKK